MVILTMTAQGASHTRAGTATGLFLGSQEKGRLAHAGGDRRDYVLKNELVPLDLDRFADPRNRRKAVPYSTAWGAPTISAGQPGNANRRPRVRGRTCMVILTMEAQGPASPRARAHPFFPPPGKRLVALVLDRVGRTYAARRSPSTSRPRAAKYESATPVNSADPTDHPRRRP